MSKKVLFVATVDRGHILKFHIPYLKYFKEQGFEVHVACSGNEVIPYCDKKHELPFDRSPYKYSNLKVYKKLKKIIDRNGFNLIHCHTPVGGMISRLAGREARKKNTKIVYTAHGFHFYKGASLINWGLYYIVEKSLSSLTDCLITINEEDYNNAIVKKFKAKSIKLVNGVGIDLKKFSPQTVKEKKELRSNYRFNETDFILTYIADLNSNKNQDLLINVVNSLRNKIPNIKLLLAGEGPLEDEYRKKVDNLGLNEIIHFLGFRNDIPNLLKLSDIAVSSSRREGLPVNIMEAMATGLPLVVSNCRGNRDLVVNNKNGFVVDIEDENNFIDAVIKLYSSKETYNRFSQNSLKLVNNYSIENVKDEMSKIYSEILMSD